MEIASLTNGNILCKLFDVSVSQIEHNVRNPSFLQWVGSSYIKTDSGLTTTITTGKKENLALISLISFGDYLSEDVNSKGLLPSSIGSILQQDGRCLHGKAKHGKI